MRLWTLHPKHLDAAGLVAVWREALLAQAVLGGRTRGYRAHPQLVRFRQCTSPLAAIATYLRAIHREATRRGYRFDRSRINGARTGRRLTVTSGQLQYEWTHLKRKLRERDPTAYRRMLKCAASEPHPLFRIVPGGVSDWERAPTRKALRGGRHGEALPW